MAMRDTVVDTEGTPTGDTRIRMTMVSAASDETVCLSVDVELARTLSRRNERNAEMNGRELQSPALAEYPKTGARGVTNSNSNSNNDNDNERSDRPCSVEERVASIIGRRGWPAAARASHSQIGGRP